MNILITGICGFVGSTLATELLEYPQIDNIIGIENFSRPGSETNRRTLASMGVEVIPGDIRSGSDVNLLPRVDWVIDAAAIPSVMAGVDGKTSSLQLIEHNLIGTVNLLEYCKRHSAGFTLLSTSRVYSIPALAAIKTATVDDAFQLADGQVLPAGMSDAGVNESYATTPPVSLYGSTKVASEQLALEYGETFGFPVWINRCGVLAGAGQFGHPAQGIFSFWIHSFRERSPLKYIGFGGCGHQVRDCLHPRDLVPLLLKQADEPNPTSKPRIVNVGGGASNARSLAQLTRWCEKRYEPMHIESTAASRQYDIPWIVMDSTLCKSTWDWNVQTPCEEILEEIADFADEHPDWLALSK